MGGAPGLQTNSTQLIVRMIHPAFCGMGGDALKCARIEVATEARSVSDLALHHYEGGLVHG
jgi:hypothetical protein